VSMQRCRECNEPIVRESKVAGVCSCCYVVLDMRRFEEAEGIPPDSWECDRCRDWGKVLERRTPGNPSFLIVVPCPDCSGG
jgi:hypothetical protein